MDAYIYIFIYIYTREARRNVAAVEKTTNGEKGGEREVGVSFVYANAYKWKAERGLATRTRKGRKREGEEEEK